MAFCSTRLVEKEKKKEKLEFKCLLRQTHTQKIFHFQKTYQNWLLEINIQKLIIKNYDVIMT